MQTRKPQTQSHGKNRKKEKRECCTVFKGGISFSIPIPSFLFPSAQTFCPKKPHRSWKTRVLTPASKKLVGVVFFHLGKNLVITEGHHVILEMVVILSPWNRDIFHRVSFWWRFTKVLYRSGKKYILHHWRKAKLHTSGTMVSLDISQLAADSHLSVDSSFPFIPITHGM